MAKRFILICIITFLFAMPVKADGVVADCAKHKNFTSDTQVNMAMNDISVVTQHSMAELNQKREDYFYFWRKGDESSFWISDDKDMGAYFMSGLGADINFALKSQPYVGQDDLMCVYIERLRFDFYVSGTALMDKAYDAYECRAEKEQALAFMDERFAASFGVVNEKQANLQKELSDIIIKLERTPVSRDRLEQKIESMKQFLNKLAEGYPQSMQEDIDARNAALAKDAGLGTRWNACKTSIRHDLAPH